MTRVTFKNSRNLTLVGNYSPGRSDAGIVLAHGFTSDRSSSGRFDRLSGALQTAGYMVLAFDFGGCGESDEDILTLDNQIDDLNCAISFVQSQGVMRIGLHGHSLGSLICLLCASPRVGTMVLSGALTDSMSYDWNQFYSETQLRELEERGYLVARDRTGRERKIGNRMLKAFEEIDQAKLLKGVHCPVLFIHGDDANDKEEMMLLDRTRRGMPLLPRGSELKVLEGADHSLRSQYGTVIDWMKEWFANHLPVADVG